MMSLLVLFSAPERSALPLATEGTQEKDRMGLLRGYPLFLIIKICKFEKKL